MSEKRQPRSGELFFIAWVLLLAALINVWTASQDDGWIRTGAVITCVFSLLTSVLAYSTAKLIHHQEKEK